MGKKASDEFTISLCRDCHYKLDTYQFGNREQTKKIFEQMLVKTEVMLSKCDDEAF